VKKNIFFIFILIELIGLYSCSSTNKYKSENMFCMVYDYDNKPVQDVNIYVNIKLVGKTDNQGRFVFTKISQEKFNLELQKDNYEVVNELITFSPMNIVYVKMGSTEQLYRLSTEFLDQRNYEKSLSLCNKALSISPFPKQDLLYLKAIILNRLNQKTESNEVLHLIKMNLETELYIKNLEEKNGQI